MLFRPSVLAIGIFCLSPSTYAFDLDDHAQLTRAAARIIQRCFPGSLTEREIRSIIESNQWEDQNILRKWTAFSHFFNPERDFHSVRASSYERILDLEEQLRELRSWRSRDDLVGKSLHHVQDMAAPPHVVPVNHFWTDGFERLPVAILERFGFSSCDELLDQASRISLAEIHRRVAEDTWKSVKNGSLRATRRAGGSLRNVSLPLMAFWSPGAEEEWGSYGIFGNAFGRENLSAALGQFQVAASEYAGYKQSRLQSALLASQLVLTKAWVLGF